MGAAVARNVGSGPGRLCLDRACARHLKRRMICAARPTWSYARAMVVARSCALLSPGARTGARRSDRLQSRPEAGHLIGQRCCHLVHGVQSGKVQQVTAQILAFDLGARQCCLGRSGRDGPDDLRDSEKLLRSVHDRRYGHGNKKNIAALQRNSSSYREPARRAESVVSRRGRSDEPGPAAADRPRASLAV